MPNHVNADDLEDKKGYYKSLGYFNGSNDNYIEKVFHVVATYYKKIALSHHPDKENSNKEKVTIFTKAESVFKE